MSDDLTPPHWGTDDIGSVLHRIESHNDVPVSVIVEAVTGLTAERDEHWKSFVHWRKEADALTELLATTNEQLEAARADAKEAEAYAEELEKERDHWQGVAGRQGVCMTCHGPRGAPEPYGCSDCLNTGYCGEWHNQMQELREKLAKAVELLKEARQDLEAYVTHDWQKDEHPFYER